jgi:YegS/Rv2252/BmrU family lipid kinase
MDDILVILNPAARSTRARSQTSAIGQLPGGAVLAITSEPGQARALAADAVRQGYRTVVAAGGDGTINEVVNGLAGSDVALGVLPVGTMNVFAAELGLPKRLREAWRVILEGKTREVDLARANRQYFVQLAGVGLDAQVVKETTWDMKRKLGPLSYLLSAAQVAARKPPKLLVHDGTRTEEGSFVLIGNGRFYGGRLEFFREARIDDGLLDVLVFKRMSHLDIARYMGNVLVGRHTTLPDVVYFQARKVRVESEEEVPVEVDGELATVLPVTFRIVSSKLKVLVPAK